MCIAMIRSIERCISLVLPMTHRGKASSIFLKSLTQDDFACYIWMSGSTVSCDLAPLHVYRVAVINKDASAIMCGVIMNGARDNGGLVVVVYKDIDTTTVT